jgi:hypothetical protein
MNPFRRCYGTLLDTAEKYPVRTIALTGLMGAKVVANCNLIATECDTSALRGVLPDSLDIVSHAGNVNVSILGAALAAGAASTIVGRLKHPSEATTWRNRAALMTGTLVAAAANAGLESINIYAADPIDAIVGIGAGALAASMVRVEDPTVIATKSE